MNDKGITTSENEKVSQAAGVIGLFTLLSRILGLVRDMVFAKYFGSGMAADAFFVAFRIPNLLRRLFAEGSLTIAFIPVFTEYLSKRSKEDAFQVARVVLTMLSIILALVTVLGIFLSPWIVRIQAWGFGGTGSKYDLTVLLTRMMFPYIFFIAIVALFMGILNSLRHFAAPAAAPIFLNLSIIISMLWISPQFSQPIQGVAVGVLIGGFFQLGLQIPWAIKKGLSLLPCWLPRHPALSRIGVLMLPAIFGSAIYQFNQFMGTLLASFLPEGSVSWLFYADRLVQFPLGVFAIAISTAALPSLSKQVAEGELDALKDTLDHALRLVFFITVPAMVGLMILGDGIVQIFFERGAFNPYSTEMTRRALLFYSLGLWAFSGIRVTVAAFYAFQDTKTPVKIASVSMIANLLFSLLLMQTQLKHAGLALALSLASSLQFCLLMVFLKRKIGEWDMVPIWLSLGKSICASTFMGLVVYFLYSGWLLPDTSLGVVRSVTYLAILLIFGVIIYFLSAMVLRCRELMVFIELTKNFLKKLRT